MDQAYHQQFKDYKFEEEKQFSQSELDQMKDTMLNLIDAG